MITHKENGYLMNYDTNEMYNAMKEFLTNTETIKKIKKGLENSEKQFDNQKIFDAVENIIIKLAQK